MTTYRQITYMIMDELKLSSDDSIITEDHIIFLANKYRSFLLKQRYSDIKKHIPESNFSTICLELIRVPAISGEACEGGEYLRTKNKIPPILYMPRVYPTDYFQGEITYIDRNRMRYVGNNKFMKNIIYCSLAPDNYIYFKSCNPQFIYLERVRLTAVFSDISEILDLQCDEEGRPCEIIDCTFPIEDSLIPPLVELIVKELRNAEYSPSDEINDAQDSLDEVK